MPTFELITALLSGLFSGLAVGLVYFALLWRSVDSLTSRRRPLVAYIVSLLVRSLFALLGFFALFHLFGSVAVLGAMPGFVFARVMALWFVEARRGHVVSRVEQRN